ncbi:MAG: hypothetical protein ACJ796_01970 [Gemmatimonadaceae bacterium]
MPLPHNDPIIEAIAERVRAVLARQPGHTPDDVASMLHLEPDALRRLVEQREDTLDTAFLIETVAAVVREFAVDPQWLLTGEYDGNAHRHALALGQDRSNEGHRALRDFVRQQYQGVRAGLSFLSLPLADGHE